MTKKRKPSVAVLGSLNVDLIASVAKLPHPGETVASTGVTKLFGGKGANQAIAAARQGVAVNFIGCVGGDPEGRAYQQRLKSEGISTTGVATRKDALTGTAIIGVDATAENLIMVSPEANGLVTSDWVTNKRRLIESADALLIQFEVPTDAILAAIRVAKTANVPVVLNPSPFRTDFPWRKVKIDTLIVNESEVRQLTGLNPGTIKRQTKKWLATLTERNINRLVITRGQESTLCLDAGGAVTETETHPVNPVDTVGAGDAFAGCFAAALARGDQLEIAITTANCAGALTTLKPGAQEAIPTRRQVATRLKAK